MNCNIDTTPDFARELKQLAKRYSSMKDESDGANITLVTIYDKSDQTSITDRELKKLMRKNGLE